METLGELMDKGVIVPTKKTIPLEETRLKQRSATVPAYYLAKKD